MKYILVYTCVSVFMFCACKNTNASGSRSQSAQTTQTKQDSLTFKLPEVPLMYNDPESRVAYLAQHYWDNFNFNDTSYIGKDVTEQVWVDYINLLNMVPYTTSQVSLTNLFKKAEANKRMLNYFIKQADHYLYDPNSPMRNEEFYIPVLKTLIASDSLLDMEKIRPKDRLDMALKNRIGTKAIDFTYTLPSGKQARMHNLKTDYILLYFHNPGCNMCEETTQKIINSPLISHLLSQKQLTILTVFPDEEVDEWKAHLSELPSNWINAYDKDMTIMYKKLYDLKAIPTLYLLGKNKEVLVKDATYEVLEANLQRILSEE